MWTVLLGAALAQQVQVDAQRFRPSLDAERTLWTDDAGHVDKEDSWFARSLLGYVRDPLVRFEGGERVGVLSDAVGLDLIGGVHFADRFRLGVQLPLYLLTTSDVSPSDGGLGDINLDGRATLLDRDDAPLGVALGLRTSLPSSVIPTLGAGGLSAEASVIVDRELGPVLLAANLGTRSLPKTRLGPKQSASDAFQYRIASAWALQDDVGLSLELAGGATYAGGPNSGPAELLAGGWVAHQGLVFHTGLGTGLSAGVGSPVLRLVAGASWSPSAPPSPAPVLASDSDGDGLRDPDDACPDQPEDADGFEDTDGCPDPSVPLEITLTGPQGGALATGHFTLTGVEQHELSSPHAQLQLHPGNYTLNAASEGFAPASQAFVVGADPPNPIQLALEPQIPVGTVALEAVTFDGDDAALSWLIEPYAALPLRSSGAQRLLLPAGEQVLHVHAESYTPQRISTQIKPDATLEVGVVLEKASVIERNGRLELVAHLPAAEGTELSEQSSAKLDDLLLAALDHPEIPILRVWLDGPADLAPEVLLYLLDIGLADASLHAEGEDAGARWVELALPGAE